MGLIVFFLYVFLYGILDFSKFLCFLFLSSLVVSTVPFCYVYLLLFFVS